MNTLVETTSSTMQDIFNSNTWIGSMFANLVADFIVALIIGVIVTKYIEHKEKSLESKNKLKLELNMLWAEVDHNKQQLEILIKELPASNLPYPALETSFWEAIDKNLLKGSLSVKDAGDLFHIYNRTYTINNMYESMLTKIHWIDESENVTTVRKEFIDMVVDRCSELLLYIKKVFPDDPI